MPPTGKVQTHFGCQNVQDFGGQRPDEEHETLQSDFKDGGESHRPRNNGWKGSKELLETNAPFSIRITRL
ncbi:hypothetical protein RvY_07526 [Ramazzottius varieornatus]|uniref:Uncharacterized protein n=1 Tax=Ramazzottius varieornatus TaxID=947166 RepID=A0A1D1V2R2_RAMVA|nr:hypothetical protein RvY_07526 [Ramazzottius varieornatus]